MTAVLAWTYIKKYAWLIFAIIAGVLAIFLFSKNPTDLSDQISEIKKYYEEEIKRIKEAEALRNKELLENQKNYELAIKNLDEKYQKAISNLDAEKKKEVQDILQKHAQDPEFLTEELARVLGFKII